MPLDFAVILTSIQKLVRLNRVCEGLILSDKVQCDLGQESPEKD